MEDYKKDWDRLEGGIEDRLHGDYKEDQDRLEEGLEERLQGNL